MPAVLRAGVLVAALLVPAACSAPDEGGSTPATEPGTAGEVPAAASGVDADPVGSLVSFAAELPADGSMTPDMLGEGLRRLAGAAGAAGVVPLDVTVDLRIGAEQVLLNPESPEVVMSVRETLGNVTDALAEEMPDAEAARLKAATNAIDANEPLTGQAAALREYLQLAAAALEASRP